MESRGKYKGDQKPIAVVSRAWEVAMVGWKRTPYGRHRRQKICFTSDGARNSRGLAFKVLRGSGFRPRAQRASRKG